MSSVGGSGSRSDVTGIETAGTDTITGIFPGAR